MSVLWLVINWDVQNFCWLGPFSETVRNRFQALSKHFPRSKWEAAGRPVTTHIPLCCVQNIRGGQWRKSIAVVDRYSLVVPAYLRLGIRHSYLGKFMVAAVQGQGLLQKCLLTSPLSSLHCGGGFVIIHLFIHLAVLLMLIAQLFKVAIELLCALRCYCGFSWWHK